MTSRGQCSKLEATEKIRPCSENCNCFLTQNLMQLKTKIAEQSRTLNIFAASNDEVRCNVELTQSEEKLFGAGTVKDDSMVCCVLVRELRAQKRDLEDMMKQWVEFVDKSDRFASLTTAIRDKLAELTPRIDSLLQETKVLEEIELENEERRRRDIDEELRRSEERQEIIRIAVNRYAEAEARDQLEQLARRAKLDALEHDRLMDRGALKLALRRMMKAMGAEDTPESAKKRETTEETSVLYPTPGMSETPPLRTAARDASPVPRDIKVSLPGQSGNHDNRPREKCIPLQGSEQSCSGNSYGGSRPRRPF